MRTQGYTEIQIAKKLQVSRSTVSRASQKIVEEKKVWLKNITDEYGFPLELGLVLERISDCISKAYELFENSENPKEKLAILKAIKDFSVEYWEKYEGLPLAASFRKFVQEKIEDNKRFHSNNKYGLPFVLPGMVERYEEQDKRHKEERKKFLESKGIKYHPELDG